MSRLTIYIKSCQVREKSNYFIIAQLDEIEYPDKQKSSQKFRTDLAHFTEYLRFQKNIFNFENLSLGNRIIIKFGCFACSPDIDVNDTNSLLRNSKLYASGSYVFTQNFITMLRKSTVLEKEMKLFDQEGIKEMGSISLVYKLKVINFEDQIYEDNREIEKVYYDPFNGNDYEISKNLNKVSELVKKKHDVMEQKMDQLDKRNVAMRALAVDLAYLRKNHQDLIDENEKMRKRIAQLQYVDEVHIEIDVLASTPQGINTLKERYAKLLLRFELERKRYDALEKEYFKIEPQLQQIKKLKTQIEEVKKAGDEQEFHLNRYKDLANRVKALKETILSQEEIINNLAYSVKNQTKDGPQESSDMQVQLNDMRYKRERLQERLKQLKLLIKMNDGKLPKDYIDKIKEEEVAENKEEVLRLRKYEDQLLTLIQETTRELDAINAKKNNYYEEQNQNFYDRGRKEWEIEKETHNINLKYLTSRSNHLQTELQMRSQSNAKVISDLKYQITMAQAKIDEKAALLY